jgi:hypothetical protein
MMIDSTINAIKAQKTTTGIVAHLVTALFQIPTAPMASAAIGITATESKSAGVSRI